MKLRTSPEKTFRHNLTIFVGPVVVVLITVMTFAIVTFGPRSSINAGTSAVRDATQALIEPADRMALASWYAITIAIALLAVWLQRRLPRKFQPQRSLKVLIYASTAVVFAAVTWSIDPAQLWAGLPVTNLILGCGLAAGIIASAASGSSRWHTLTQLLAVIMVLLAISAWIETPSTLLDSYDFAFTSDELSAVAAGHWPLANYASQYSVLLPFLFNIPLHFAPTHAPMVILVGILALQLLAVAIAVTFPCLIDGRRRLAPALLVMLPPLFATTASENTAMSYFQTVPLRIVLPLATLLLAFWVLGGIGNAQRHWILKYLGLGLLGGVTAFNNPDFGLVALITVVVATAASARTVLWALPRLGLILGAAVAVPAGYALVSQLHGTPVNWRLLLIFQDTFGLAGYMNYPMYAFGLQVALASLFAIASIIGFYLLRTSRSDVGSFRYRQGLAAALTGGWGMLTLPYLAGRSLPPTYLGSYAFTAGLVLASLLPLVLRAWRAAGPAPVDSAVFSTRVLSVVAYGAALACLFYLPAPSRRVEAIAASGPVELYPALEGQNNALKKAKGPNGQLLREATAGKRVVQVLLYANLEQLVYHRRAANVSSSPDYIDTSAEFARLQCSVALPADTEYFLTRLTTYRYLQSEPACVGYAQWDQQRSFAVTPTVPDEQVFVLVPVAK
jgi:hypothetical protein